MSRKGRFVLSILVLVVISSGPIVAAGFGTAPVWTFEGSQSSEDLAQAVALTDVNGDGLDDLIVGSPFRTGSTPYQHTGEVLVFFGSPSGPSTTPSQILVTPNQEFGHALAAVGDWNGDGFNDLAVESSFNPARVQIFLGSSLGLGSFPSWEVTGPGTFGQGIGAAGDVNGDGFPDLLVGDYFYDNGALHHAGRAYLFFGGPGASTQPAWTYTGDQANSNLGAPLSGAGDINGDGFADIIVSQTGWTVSQMQHNKLVQYQTGRALVFLGSASGPAAAPDWITVGPINSLYGSAVGSAGDVNGDGFGDVIVGDNQADVALKGGGPNHPTGDNRGMAFVYLGSSVGLATTPSWTVTGDDDGAFLGDAVASGDINNDGFSDVIVTAPLRTSPGVQQGRIYAYLGSSSGLATTASWFIDGGQAGAGGAGLPLATGKVNGDSRTDLLVGVPSWDGAAGVNTGRAEFYVADSN